MRKREDSYFGIHFDFHATESDIVGIIYKPEIVAEALDRIKPDFVQCDTRDIREFQAIQRRSVILRRKWWEISLKHGEN